MKKATLLLAIVLLFLGHTTMATISDFRIINQNGGTIPSNIFTSPVNDWNKSGFSRIIPLSGSETNTYRIEFNGDWLDTHTKIEITQSGGTGTVSGVTVSNIVKASKKVTLDLRVANSVTDGTRFRLRFRYLAETNCGEPGGCGDNVQFKVVNRGTISNITINPAPIRSGDTIILRNGTNYLLTFSLTGATGTETQINTNFGQGGEVFFVAPLIANKTASTFTMTLGANLNARIASVINRLENVFFDTDVDAEFKGTGSSARYIKYLISSNLSNTGANVNLKFVKGETPTPLPDLIPSTISPSITLFKPLSTNSFQGGGTNIYFPVDQSFCPPALQNQQGFVDGSLSGNVFTHNLSPVSWGVTNIGDVTANGVFRNKIIRFTSLSDTAFTNSGIVMDTLIIPTANPLVTGSTRSSNFNRPQIEAFTIAGKTGCYLKRSNANTPNPREEAAYKILVDFSFNTNEKNELNNTLIIK
jgi:hypothetical protein